MALNGISELATKQLRQEAKLEIAEAKRQGKSVALDGTITGSLDSTKPYNRTYNVLDTTELPSLYSDNAVVDNANTGGLQVTRPWDPQP